ncbi:heterokaryon incompatibility protein-domain-containing protein [Hypomontagnella monticulosa]|nr:heterokaryon incompatibility protein-domain-containing protein [Hypomontagnella monticulosa]
MDTTEFQYAPLDRSTRTIRLLRFLPGPSFVDCKLKTYTIDECPRYIALSYVWGTDEPTHKIWLNNRVFFIRTNLWHALSKLANLPRLGLGTKREYFWIDALCINQNDPLERGHQVDLMGLIFSKACITIAWLGPAEDGSDFAMETLATHLYLVAEEDKALSGQKLRREMDRAIHSLLSRDYFSRMWIVQEILLSRNVWVLCGSKCRPWPSLSRYAERNLTPNHNFQPSIPNAAQALITARNSLLSGKYPWHSLDILLMWFGAGKCSDARDRVYGLLGLLKTTSQQSTIPQADYTISAVQVYCRAMAFMQDEQIFLPNDPSYCEEVSTALANALELPRNTHESISIISTTVFHFRYEIKTSGYCGFSELLHRCILPLQETCDVKLTSPFRYGKKYKEVIRKLDFFPVDDNPRMWSEFEETLRSLLRVWSDYIRHDPKMERIPSKLTFPLDKPHRNRVWAIYQRFLQNTKLLIDEVRVTAPYQITNPSCK